MTTADGPQNTAAKAGLVLSNAADLLLRETRSAHDVFAVKTGIKSIDSQLRDVLTSGKVLGVGSLVGEESFNLSMAMVASVLLEKSGLATTTATETYVSVLCSPGTTFITQLHELLKQRLENMHARSAEDAVTTATTLLDHVQLLPYLDLAGLAETLSEASGELFKMHQDRQQSVAIQHGQSRSKRFVLLVEGLSVLLGSIHRRSGMTEAAAMVSNILRTIKHLSRTYKDLFVLVELDVTSDIPMEAGDGLHSAFSSATGEIMRIAPGGVLSGIVENAIDVVVCVHDGFGKTKPLQKRKRDGQPQPQPQPQSQPQPQTRIVEVVKDGVGGGVGEWCIWVQ